MRQVGFPSFPRISNLTFPLPETGLMLCSIHDFCTSLSLYLFSCKYWRICIFFRAQIKQNIPALHLASSKTCIQQVATEAPEISKRTTILTNRHTGTKLRQKQRGKIVKGNYQEQRSNLTIALKILKRPCHFLTVIKHNISCN